MVSRNLYVMASTVSLASIGAVSGAEPRVTHNISVSPSFSINAGKLTTARVLPSGKPVIDIHNVSNRSHVFVAKSSKSKRALSVAESGVLRRALFNSVRVRKTLARA